MATPQRCCGRIRDGNVSGVYGKETIIINDTRSTSIAQLRSGSSSRISTRSAVMPAISAAASPIHIHIHINSKIPTYCGKSPVYGLESCLTAYCQKSPTCGEKNIAYCEKRPTHCGKSRKHNLKSRLIVCTVKRARHFVKRNTAYCEKSWRSSTSSRCTHDVWVIHHVYSGSSTAPAVHILLIHHVPLYTYYGIWSSSRTVSSILLIHNICTASYVYYSYIIYLQLPL